MKAKLILTALFTFYFLLFPCKAQVPQGFNYQAIARDGLGYPIVGATLIVKLGIQADTTASPVILWEEQFTGVKTTAFGMFTVVIGTGSKTGGSATTFSDVNWTVTPLYLKTQIFYLGAWKYMGSSKLWSVPYSMMAGNLEGTVPLLSVKGNTATMDSALFVVRNNTGQIVFAVYNEGVRIYVDDGIPGKGAKGGFAIGSFNKSKGTQDYFVVTGDSIRAYIDTGLVKARKGGFAIGSFNKSKIGPEEYFRVTRDSTRFYISSSASKAAKGGFAIGSFDKTKGLIPQYLAVNPNRTTVQVNDSTKGFMVSNIQTGASQNFMNMTVENYFIGYQSGSLTAPGVGDVGKYNSFMGYQSGVKNVTGKKNVYLGFQSGFSSNDANYNVLIGNESGKFNANGANNTFIGYWSGQNNNGSYNTFIGERAGNKNTTGTFNVLLGARAGLNINTANASYNTMVGSYSGYFSNNARTNVFIGGLSGYNNRVGAGNVCIGYQAGYNNKMSKRLYIADSLLYPPLIYGEFDNKSVVINDTLTHAYTFFVNGSAGGTSAWAVFSDVRLKKNVTSISDPIEKIMQMRGVEFEWKDNTVNDPGRHIGFIAQEMDKVVPEVVKHDGDYWSMQYAPITAVLVEAFKAQQKVIGKQQQDIEEIKKFNGELFELNKQLLNRLEELEKHTERTIK